SLSLSLRRSPTREVTSPFILRAGRPRQYTAFLASMQEKSAYFLSPSYDGGGAVTDAKKQNSL
ncbi:MAG: hypothetical protein IJ533_09795, partial [Prevotella sp.]|nr:hypothetical protein [Prevotella sp.]